MKNRPSAQILCVGTELLLGNVFDTNSHAISIGLAELGINLYYRKTVGDNRDRLAMCKIAFKNPKYEISTMEMDRESDSYTIYTIEELKKKYPNDDLYLIIGSDMFLIFHKWYRHKEILEKCTVCVASRNTDENIQSLRAYAFEQLGVYMPKLDGKNIHISLLDAYEVSSSEIRERIADERSLYGIVDPEIIEYMEKHKLYGYGKKR